MSELRVCHRCHRHVFAHERACPFCAAPRRAVALAALAGAGMTAVACMPTAVYGPPPGPVYGPPPVPSHTCEVVEGPSELLIADWPPSVRADLEIAMRRGAAFVRWEGCEVEVLTHCTAGGQYAFARTDLKETRVAMHDADALYAALPSTAVRLENELRRGKEVRVETVKVGSYHLEPAEVSRAELAGMCRGVTHVVTGVAVGAFELTSGADHPEVLAKGGKKAACVESPGSDQEPPDSCRELVELELTPLSLEE